MCFVILHPNGKSGGEFGELLVIELQNNWELIWSTVTECEGGKG